jgi:hypothetical protein
MQAACEAGTAPYMSKRKSFVEATDSLLAAFANAGGGAVNSNFSKNIIDKREGFMYYIFCVPHS